MNEWKWKKSESSFLTASDKDLRDNIISKHWVIVPLFACVPSCLYNIFIIRLKI